MRLSQGAAAPDECTKQKQSQGAREHVDVQGNEQPDFAKAERQHLPEATGWINLIGLLYVTLDRTKAGKQSSRRPFLHREIHPKERRRAARQQPAGTEQKRQDDQARERIFGENVAIPDQTQVDQSEHQQDDQPAKQEKCAARACRKMLELNCKSYPEQEREESKCLQIDGQHQNSLYGPVEWRCGPSRGQESLENRNAEFHDQIHRQNAEQCDAAECVDTVDTVRWVHRAGAFVKNWGAGHRTTIIDCKKILDRCSCRFLA